MEADRLAAEEDIRRARIAADLEAEAYRRERRIVEIEAENAARRSRIEAEIKLSRLAATASRFY